MGDSNPLAIFGYVARALGERNLAFIFAREGQGEGYIGDQLKQHFGGVYIANQGLDQPTAEALINSGQADAVAFGKPFIANPDLPQRFSLNAALNTPNPETFYVGGEHGYNDYPKL
jgi:2,4-dienoyl-CoA reductase-like NADH-dependent reductase (Old Yellow Enzyme family)